MSHVGISQADDMYISMYKVITSMTKLIMHVYISVVEINQSHYVSSTR